MNVAPVLQVSRPYQSIPSAGAVAVFGAHAPAGQLGAFSSLLDGLVNENGESLLAGMNEEQPVDLPKSNTAPVSAKGKGKATKSEENNDVAGKKNEPKPKSGLVQATEAPPPPISKPPILFRSVTWETYSQSAATPTSETSINVAPAGHVDTASISTTSSPNGTASIPAENESASTERIAFGLHLTTSNPETSTATQSSTPEPQTMRVAAPLLSGEPKETGDAVASTQDSSNQADRLSAPPLSSLTGRVLDLKLNNPTPQNAEADRPLPQISAARVTADANHVASSVSTPPNNEVELSVPDQSLPSHAKESTPTKVPDAPMSPRSADDRLDNATTSRPAAETSSANGSSPTPAASRQVSSGHLAASSEYAVKRLGSDRSTPLGERPSQGSNSDGKPAPDPRGNATPVSILSESLAQSQAANLRMVDIQNLPQDAAKQQVVSGNTSGSTPADQGDATPVGTPAQARVIPLGVQQQQKPAEKSVNDGPAPKVTPPQTGAKRDLPEASRNESRDGADTEAQAQPTQVSGGPDTRTGRSAVDPSRATPSRTTPSQSTPSQGTLSEASSSQATPIQATASEAKASEAPKVVNEPEINAAPQAQPARQISLKLTGDDSSKVTVDLSERAGKVQVSVRTADPELAKSLRGDLGDLVGRLEGKGFKTEAWVPTASRHTPAATPEQSGSSNSQGGERHTGSGTDQRQGRQGQNGSNPRQQARWKTQLEETLSTEETRTNNE